MIWAMPRASLRSVLFRIAFKAAFTCRVSMQITAKPGRTGRHGAMAITDQPPGPPASGKPGAAQHFGDCRRWLATLFSTTILPSLSTMQMLVCSNETSSPAKYSIAVLHP
jgi:hypothetical protein